MIVVDSSVWIDFLNGIQSPQVAHLFDRLGEEPVLVGDLILLEVLQGVAGERQAARVEAALRRFDVVPMLDPDLAVIAAAHYRTLRGLGVTIAKTIDLVIATFCITRGHALLTADRNFLPMAKHLGLQLI